MKTNTLKQIPFAAALECGLTTLSTYDEPRYNAMERTECETGFQGSNKPNASCIFSVHKIEDEIAHTQYWNGWNRIINQTCPVTNLVLCSSSYPFKPILTK